MRRAFQASFAALTILSTSLARWGAVAAFSPRDCSLVARSFTTAAARRQTSCLRLGVQESLDSLHQLSTVLQQRHYLELLTQLPIVINGGDDVVGPWKDQVSQLLADATSASNVPNMGPGWWQAYLQIFKNTLSWVHSTLDGPLNSIGVENTWGISIAVFTTGVRSLLLPLSIQQSKSSEYMKALKPYMSEIKEKFKNNQDAQNRAIGKLYEDAKQNPLAGCLVSLLQLPVFLGLYRGVRLLAKEGKLEESFLWIPSLEGPVSPPNYQGLDWLTQGWQSVPGQALPVPPLGWEMTLSFLAMPMILVVLQSITMNALQPPIDDNATDEERETLERSQTVLKFLPLMIGFFSLQVPAGLTIYWFTSNIFTLSQSLGVRAYFAANPPKIELPEYWETALSKDSDAYRDLSSDDRRKAAEAGIRVGPTFEDMVAEARFHAVVERRPFAKETDAWARAQQASSVPTDLKDWVGKGGVGKSMPAPTHESAVMQQPQALNTTAVAS